jgi:hypothetical protein
MTAAVCNRFLLSPYTFSSSLQRVRRISGGFTSKIVRLKHSISQHSVVPDVFFLRSVVSASASVSLDPSSSSAVRDNQPHPHPFKYEKISQIYFRTRMAHRSLDGFRCGCRLCGLRSVVQPSTYRRRARGPAPAHRVEIASFIPSTLR